MNAELTNTRKRTRLDRKFDRLRDAEEAGKLGKMCIRDRMWRPPSGLSRSPS